MKTHYAQDAGVDNGFAFDGRLGDAATAPPPGPFSVASKPVALIAAAAASVPIDQPTGDERRSGFDRRARSDRRGGDRRVCQQPFDGPDRRSGDRRERARGERRSGVDRRSGLPSNLETLEQRRHMSASGQSADAVAFDSGSLNLVGGGEHRNDLVVQLSEDGSHLRGVVNATVGQWQKIDAVQRIIITGGDRADRVRVDNNLTIPVFVDGRDGNDDLQTARGDDTLIGGGGDDRLEGAGGDDRLEGHAGNDTLIGGGGGDVLSGGSGHDWLVGGEGDDRLDANGGLDVLLGGEGTDVLNGDRDDHLSGGEGSDAVARAAGGLDDGAKSQLSHVTRFALVNADTGAILNGHHNLSDGTTINLDELGTDNLSVRAYVDGAGGGKFTGSVRFAIDGQTVQLENMRPYALLGDFNGVWSAWSPESGIHTLSATPYDKNEGGGDVGLGKTIRLEFTRDDPAPAVERLALVDAGTGKVIPGFGDLQDGQHVPAGLMHDRDVKLQAYTRNDAAESVIFSVDGNLAVVENLAPYAVHVDLRGRSGDDIDVGNRAWTPRAGSRTIDVQAFSGNDGRGTSAGGRSLELVFVEDAVAPSAPSQGSVAGWNPQASNPDGALARLRLTTPAVTQTGHAVHVNAADTRLREGDWDNVDFEWDFGDAGGRYNTLGGYNAAHIYDRPGTYTVRLRVTDPSGRQSFAQTRVTVTPAEYQHTLYVDARNGSDAHSGTNHGQALRTVAAAVNRANALGGDAEVLLRRGQSHDVQLAIHLNAPDIRIAGYGAGQKPIVRYSGQAGRAGIFYVNKSAPDAVIEGLTLDSRWTGTDGEKAGLPIGISAVGDNLTVRDNEFRNLVDGVNANGNPKRLMVQDNEAPLTTGIRGYMVWLQGQDAVILGNTAANSTREHILRMVDTDRVLVAHNEFQNLDRRAVDRYDDAKGSLVVQQGKFAWAEDNILRGPAGVGPLGDGDGLNIKWHRWEYAVFKDNVFENRPLFVEHGAEHIRVENNLFNTSGIEAIAIDGWNNTYGRGVVDLTIADNVSVNVAENGRFLSVYNRVDGMAVTGNVYLADDIRVGSHGTANAYFNISAGEFAGTVVAHDNTWSVPGRITNWAQGGHIYVGRGYTQDGHMTPAEWNDLRGVGNDRFADLDDDAVIGDWFATHADLGRAGRTGAVLQPAA